MSKHMFTKNSKNQFPWTRDTYISHLDNTFSCLSYTFCIFPFFVVVGAFGGNMLRKIYLFSLLKAAILAYFVKFILSGLVVRAMTPASGPN